MKTVDIKCSTCGHVTGNTVVFDDRDRQTDAGRFRIALHDAGFSATPTIFSDTRKKFRRLKLWFGNYVVDAPQDRKVKLVDKLIDQFGDRLLAVDSKRDWRGGYNVIVKLKP